MVSSGIVHVAKHFVFHADYDDAFEPMLFHLANQTDYKGFVERARREDREFAKQHHVDYSARPSAAPRTKASAATLNDEGPTDKANGTDYADDAAPHKASDGAAAAAQAKLDGQNQEPLQKLTPLPPRSSSLPSSARKTHVNIPGQPGAPQAPANAVLPDPGSSTAYKWKHFDFETSPYLNNLAEEFYSKLRPQPKVAPDAMSTAVLESIAGVEAIFKDGMDRDSPELKEEVTSVSPPTADLLPAAVLRGSPRRLQITKTCCGQAVELMERLNNEHVKSEQVDRKLGAVAKTQGCCSIQPDEESVGRTHVCVTTAGSYQGCECKKVKQGGPETKATHGDEAFRCGEGMEGSIGEDSDLLWKAYVSNIASSKL